MIYRWIAFVLYVFMAFVSGGTTVVWTYEVFAWVWRLEPITMSLLMFGLPAATIMAWLIDTGDARPGTPVLPDVDTRRENPQEPKYRNPTPRRRPEPMVRRDVPPPVDLDSLPRARPDVQEARPRRREPGRTAPTKPTPPKIWGIDP